MGEALIEPGPHERSALRDAKKMHPEQTDGCLCIPLLAMIGPPPRRAHEDGPICSPPLHRPSDDNAPPRAFSIVLILRVTYHPPSFPGSPFLSPFLSSLLLWSLHKLVTASCELENSRANAFGGKEGLEGWPL